jgi:hypothetical protein
VFSIQWEPGDGMIKLATPSFWRVTDTTVHAKLTVMVIIIGVTGKQFRRSLITIRMAGFALHAMFPGKRKPVLPWSKVTSDHCVRLMTGAAIRAKLTVVVILVGGQE